MKLDFLVWFVSALATYRLTIFIVRDRGPFRIFARARKLSSCSKLLTCPFCVSPYAATIVCTLLYLADVRVPLAYWFLLGFSLSSVTIILDRTFSADIVNN